MKLRSCKPGRHLWFLTYLPRRVLDKEAPPAWPVVVQGLHTYPNGSQGVRVMLLDEDGTVIHGHLVDADDLHGTKGAAYRAAARRLEATLEPDKEYARQVRARCKEIRKEACL